MIPHAPTAERRSSQAAHSLLAGPSRRACGWLLITLLLGCYFPGVTVGDESFLQGLAERRLFRLAAIECRERLGTDDLSPAERAALTIELLRTLAQHAVHAPPQDRVALWESARETGARFRTEQADNPHVLLVRLQDALTVLVRSEVARQEAEVGANRTRALASVLETIRVAIRLLQQLDRDIAKEMPLRTGKLKPDELSSIELASLRSNVHFQMARAYRNRSLCYEPASNDRVAALTQALRTLDQPLTQMHDDQPLYWQLREEQARCLRLSGALDAARKTIQQGLQAELEPAQAARLQAEAIRIELAEGNLSKARLLAESSTAAGALSAELDYARMETLVALWQSAAESNDKSLGQRLRDASLAQAKRMEVSHGPYWGRRADLLLVRAAGGGSSGNDAEILARAADDLYLKGQLEQALAAYQQAADQANSAGDVNRAVGLAYKAALVLEKQQKIEAFLVALRKVATMHETHPQASSIHFRSIQQAARLAQTQPASLAQYEQLLDEHIELWPEQVTTNTARHWLGRLHESRRSWPAAVDAFAGVSESDPEYAKAMQSAGRCWLAWLDQLRLGGEDLGAETDAALKFLEQLVFTKDGRQPQQWTDVARQAALHAAIVHMRFRADGMARAETLLSAAAKGPPPASADWQAKLASQRLVALAAAGKIEAAREEIEHLAAVTPGQSLQVLQQLGALPQARDETTRRQIAGLLLAGSQRLGQQRDQLQPTARRSLQLLEAQALVDSDRWPEAKQIYEQLRVTYPDDHTILEQYAGLLLVRPDQASVGQSLGLWRLIAQRTKPQTASWFEAKYSIALANFKLGDKERAAQLIRYLQQTTSDLGGGGLKRRFLQLLARCSD